MRSAFHTIAMRRSALGSTMRFAHCVENEDPSFPEVQDLGHGKRQRRIM
jgi:hypothetical protein